MLTRQNDDINSVMRKFSCLCWKKHLLQLNWLDNETQGFTEQKPQSTRSFHVCERYKTALLPFSEMTTERYWVECLESRWCQWCALLCISFPCWCGCRRTQQNKQVLCHAIYSKKHSQPSNPFPMAFSSKMGGAGKGPGIGSSSPRVHLTPLNPFPASFNGIVLGTRLANVPSER